MPQRMPSAVFGLPKELCEAFVQRQPNWRQATQVKLFGKGRKSRSVPLMDKTVSLLKQKPCAAVVTAAHVVEHMQHPPLFMVLEPEGPFFSEEAGHIWGKLPCETITA